MELTSGFANTARDGFDRDVANYLLAIVSREEHNAKGGNEPVPEAGGYGSGLARKRS